MGRLGDIVFDCAHPASLARFWAAALDGYEVAPYDQDELARLRDLGVHDVEDDPTVLVLPPGPSAPRLFFQRVPEPRTAKNRVHLDLRAAEHDPEVDRLVRLGATVAAAFPTFTTLLDPERNEFCLMRP